MNKPITIDNFLRSAPQVPQYSDKNQNYMVVNADPLHYLSDNTQEEQVAPLIAARKFTALDPITGGHNVVDMCDAGNTVPFDVFVVDNYYYVHGYFVGGSVLDIGQPTSGLDAKARIKFFGPHLVFRSPTKLYYIDVPFTTWTDITATSTIPAPTVYSTSVSHLEPFKGYMIVSVDGNIWRMKDSFVATLAVALGINALVTKLQNFNDKYLAIAYNQGVSVNDNFIALWDGINPEPNYTVKVPGIFQDMFVDNTGALNVMVLENAGQSALYYLVGTALRRKQSIQYDYCSNPDYTTTFYPANIFFNFRGTMGVNLHSKGNLLIGNSDAGAVEYIFNDTKFTKLFNAGNGILYAGVGSAMSYFLETGNSYSPITYTTQWIPVRNLQGIDIWYDTPPASGTDAINLTVYGQGENLTPSATSVDATGLQTIVCTPIIPGATDTAKRTRVALRDKNNNEEFAGDQVKIVLTTVNTGTWRAKINAINLI